MWKDIGVQIQMELKLITQKIPGANNLNSQLKNIRETDDRLKQDQEAQQRSIDAQLLRNKLDEITNQLRQINQQNSSDTCSALYNFHFGNPLTCSDSDYQKILKKIEEEKNQADAMLWKRGLVGNIEIKNEEMAKIDVKYKTELDSCRSLQEYNKKAMQDYEQCKADQSKYQSEKIQREQILLQEKLKSEKDLNGIEYCFATYGKNIKFDSNYNCSCADGYYVVDGYCTNRNELDYACKQSFGENGVVKNIKDGEGSCACKSGYELVNSQCLQTQTTNSVSPVIPVNIPADIKTAQPSVKVIDFSKYGLVKPKQTSLNSTSSVTVFLKKSSFTDIVATSSGVISKTEKFFGWIKGIFGFRK